MSAVSNRSSMGVITQIALAIYREHRQQLAALNHQLREEQQRLLRLVEADAPVEAGPLRARVEISRQQRLTKPVLIAALGQAGYDTLRVQAAPTACRRLVIEDAPHGAPPVPDRGGPGLRRANE